MPLLSRSKSRNKDSTSPQNTQVSSGYPPPNSYQIPNGYQNFHHSQNMYSPIPSRPQNVGYQPSNYGQQPNIPSGSMALVTVSDTTGAMQNPVGQAITQWQPPPLPPRLQRATPGGQTTTMASSPMLEEPPEPRRASSSTCSRPIPSSRFATPSPSRYLETPPSPWTQSGQVRSPSPAVLPQRNTRQQEPPKVRKILSLDGGGIRGLSIIITLKYIMSQLNRKRGTALDPWQEFDMIGGTSTGGLIAIMLGRLRMSLLDCEAAYIRLSSEIFTPVRNNSDPRRIYDFFKANGKFDEKPLELCIKKAVTDYGLDEDALLQEFDTDLEPCKVFVCATRGENSTPAVIRSYESNNLHDPLIEVCKIWEAARATSAASTFFEPVAIGPYKELFVDGALRRNNPIREADKESRDLWPGAERLIISIGTGSAPGGSAVGNLYSLAQRLKDIVTDSEQTSQDFESANEAMIANNRLFRFNVYHGLAEVGLEEYKAANLIAAHTNTYLTNPQTTRLVNTCVQSLRSGGQRLGYATLEEITEMMALAQLQGVVAQTCGACLRGIMYNETYHYCSTCDDSLCRYCHGGHEYSHFEQMLRFVISGWTPTMKISSPTKDCAICSREAKARTECTECSMAICVNCVSINNLREKWFQGHKAEHPRHKSYRVFNPPYTYRKPPSSWACACLDTHGAIFHCDRCTDLIHVNEKLYACQTCKMEFSGSQGLCQSCMDDEAPEHLSHDFRCYTLHRTVDRPDDFDIQSRSLYRCEVCTFETGPTSPGYHEHLDMKFCIGDAVADILRQNLPTDCPKGLPRKLLAAKGPSPNDSAINCMICRKRLQYETRTLVCFECGAACCHECLERCWHRHGPLSRMRLKKMVVANVNPFGFVEWTCDLCGKASTFTCFTGFECQLCRNYQTCLACLSQSKYPNHPSCNGVVPDWTLTTAVS